MILPDHHDIPVNLYNERRGEFTYDDEEGIERCKICGAETTVAGDKFGGAVYCSENGAMLFDF